MHEPKVRISDLNLKVAFYKKKKVIVSIETAISENKLHLVKLILRLGVFIATSVTLIFTPLNNRKNETL